MTNLDLDKVRKLTRRYDELPPVEIRKLPPWYWRPLNLIVLTILSLIALVIYLAGGSL